LADAQKDLADAQKRTEERVEQLTESQTELTDAQKRTELTLSEVVTTQQKMLIRLDRLDGHMLEDKVAKNLPAFWAASFAGAASWNARSLSRASRDGCPKPSLPT